jgi:hypothetical protein
MSDELNLQAMTPTELAHLLNSSSYSGGMISPSIIKRLLDLSAFHVRKNPREKINFLRFASWLFRHLLTHEDYLEEQVAKRVEAYKRQREKTIERQRISVEAHREIGDFVFCDNPERRESCRNSFRDFCTTYLSQRFELPFGEMHDDCISTIERIILGDGQFAFAMPRGSGKTTLLEAAVIWATLYSHRRFVVILSATETQAAAFLNSIKQEIEINESIEEDFRNLTLPIHRSSGRYTLQTYKGNLIRYAWTPKLLSFPTIEGSEISGNRIISAGITSSIRGLSANINGKKYRPDLVIIDDPQTDESSKSIVQTTNRENVVNGAVLGLAGPNKTIAAILAGTIICRDDLVDRIVDNKRNPQWHGQRYPMLSSFPSRLDLWQHYYEILIGQERRIANQFYIANRDAMDYGARVTWQHRYTSEQVSAIQHALELYLRAPEVFYAEYQNMPKSLSDSALVQIENLERKIVPTKRYLSPNDAAIISVGIDVQSEIIYYTMIAWNPSGGGTIIDYGTYPEQGGLAFSASSPTRGLSAVYPELSAEQRIYNSLDSLTNLLLSRSYLRENGTQINIERILVDSGYQSNVIYRWARESKLRSIIIPAKGYSIAATSKPISEWPLKLGDRAGNNWRIRAATGQYLSQLVIFDANYWKTTFAERISSANTTNSLNIYNETNAFHQAFFSHLMAEIPIRVTSRTREAIEWRVKPTNPENHWLDSSVLAMVAASISGINNNIFPSGNNSEIGDKRNKRKWSEIAAEQKAKKRRQN